MLFSGFPLPCRCRGDTRDSLREAWDSTKRYRSSAEQLTRERVKLRSLRLLSEHEQALDHIREHPPRTPAVVLAATRNKRALFVKDFQRTIPIACISHLSKKRPDADSLANPRYFMARRRLRQQQRTCPAPAEEIPQTPLAL